MRTAFALSVVIHVAVLTVALAWWTAPDPIEAPLTQGIAVDLVPPPEQTEEKKPEPKREQPPILVPPSLSSSSLAAPPQAAPAPPPPKEEAKPATPPAPEPQIAALKPIAPEWTEPSGESPPGNAPSANPPPAAVQDEVQQLPEPEIVEQMTRLSRPVEFDAAAEVNARLTTEEIAAFLEQIRKCWVRPAALAEAQRLWVIVRVALRNNGSLMGEPEAIEGSPSVALGAVLIKTIVEAVRQCQPYTSLPRAKYAEWQVLDLRFTPDGPSGK